MAVTMYQMREAAVERYCHSLRALTPRGRGAIISSIGTLQEITVTTETWDYEGR